MAPDVTGTLANSAPSRQSQFSLRTRAADRADRSDNKRRAAAARLRGPRILSHSPAADERAFWVSSLAPASQEGSVGVGPVGVDNPRDLPRVRSHTETAGN